MRAISSGGVSGGLVSPSLSGIFSPTIGREGGPLLAQSWSSHDQPPEAEVWTTVPATTEGFVYYWNPNSNQVSWVLPKANVEAQINAWAQRHSESVAEHPTVEDRGSGSRTSLNAKLTDDVQVQAHVQCMIYSR